MKKLPKRIYVQSAGADNDKYLDAREEFSILEDGLVGVYELVETKVKSTTSRLD